MAYVITDYKYSGLFPNNGFGFWGVGNQLWFYQYSLYWLVHNVGLQIVSAEVTSDGEPLLYGQLSEYELETLFSQKSIIGLKRHSWGVSWPYQGQQIGGSNSDFSQYQSWRDHLLQDSCQFLYNIHLEQPRQPWSY